jgi:16S rRNA (adenine1518-N6/adenine1519-N6)-dimethyltransferase
VERVHLERVVQTAQIGVDDRVLEIGPGAGTLTIALAEAGACVAAVELDRGLLPVLADALAPYADRVAVHQADALKLDLLAFIRLQFGADVSPATVKVVANIPYNITSPLLVHLLQARPAFSSITLMIQKEVADRLCAGPGQSEYGALTVFVAYHASITLAGVVPRGAFYPPPRVDSAIVHITPYRQAPVTVASETSFFAVSRAAFGQRRKTLANALINAPALSFDREMVLAALSSAGVDGQRRGETLSLQEIAAIANALPFDAGAVAVVRH